MRFFNTSGPVVAEDHYCIPPLERLDLGRGASAHSRPNATSSCTRPGKRARPRPCWPCATCSTERLATVACTSMLRVPKPCAKMWNGRHTSSWANWPLGRVQ